LLCCVHGIIPLLVALGDECVEVLSLIGQISEFCRGAASFNKQYSLFHVVI
jgi:hypothetical protein